MRIIYTIGIWFYTLGIRLAALFGHSKARLMVDGWKRWPEQVAKLNHERPTVWFHAASLGEFEQARPVLEEYRRRHPECQVLVTFFSPSGYEVRKNYGQAEAVCYLPMDTPRNVRRFLDAVQPAKVFFVKYEFWYNYLDGLRNRGAETYIISAIFRPEQYFFQWYGKWFLRQIGISFRHLFVQNEESLQLLKAHGIEHCSMAGDTRFDRVHQIAQAAESNEVVEAWLDGHEGKVLVGGSTWPPDEEVLKECVNALMSKCASQANEPTISPINSLKIILAPHVISEEHLKQIEQLFPDSIRYSQLSTQHSTLNTKKVLIIDNIGILSKLYRYADVAYIGGGFGVGIHNILEAVTFGKPVVFGPNYHKFQEAKDIIACGGGFTHSDSSQLATNLLPLLTDADAYGKASHACHDYMQQNLGSTDIILNTIES